MTDPITRTERVGRFYTWKHGYKWALKSHSLIAFLRVMWLSYILFYNGESCQDCGRRYVLWWADDNLYQEVHGNLAGLLCPNCFDKQARKLGITLKWRPTI